MNSHPEHPLLLSDGRYRIKRVLGVGGMSVVLLAHDYKMGVDRAIKLLHKRMARSPALRTRFENEARAQARLSHPNILTVHDVVEEEAGMYLVMELAEGGSLATRVETLGACSPREVARIGGVLASALEVAHVEGVIHRDIKPENILIDRFGNLKIADFGIARLRTEDVQLTGTGMIMGTWVYMPPEQRESARDVDGRADIYALGVTLYFLLSGRLPPALHNTEAHEQYFEGLPDALVAVIAKATRFRPEDRYGSCAALQQALESIEASLPDEPVPSSRTAVQGARRERGFGEVLDLGILERDHPDAFQTLLPLVDEWSKTQACEAPEAVVPETPAAPEVPRTPSPTVLLDAPDSAPPSRVPRLLLATLGVALVVLPAVFLLPALFAPEEAALSVPEPAAPLEPTEPAPAAEVQDPSTAAVEPQAGGDEPSSAPPAEEPLSPSPERRVSGAATPSEPAAAEAAVGGGERKRTPRVITVVSPPVETGATVLDDEEDQAPQAPEGLLVVRTVPSGAEVWSSGALLVKRGQGYPLSAGRHLVELRAPGGESTLIPLTIRADDIVEVCYSFDTNRACGSDHQE